MADLYTFNKVSKTFAGPAEELSSYGRQINVIE